MVKNKALPTEIALLITLFFFLSVAYAFDQISLDIPSYVIGGSPYTEILKLIYPLAMLFIDIVAVLLFWLMHNKLQQRKWVEILYLVTGLFITFAYNLFSLKTVPAFLAQPLFGSPVPMVILLQSVFWPNTYFHIAGSLIGAVGVLLLLLPKNKASQS
jgi:drug/metabolite transporter (DMT)-like permease